MAGGASIRWEGMQAFELALGEYKAKALAATRAGASEGAHLIQLRMQEKANTGRHKIGEPTSAVPGSGPNVVTGTLRRSIRAGPIVSDGRGFAAKIGPTAVYGRRVELGYNGSPPLPIRDFRPRSRDPRAPGDLPPHLFGKSAVTLHG